MTKQDQAVTEVLPEQDLPPIKKSVFDWFETDEGLESAGVEFYFGEGAGTWTLAYVGDQAFQSALSDRMKPYSHAQAQGLLDPSIAEGILVDLYAEYIVKHFKDVIGEDGKPIKYDLEATKKLLGLKHLFRIIREAASNFANYRKVYVDESSKK